MTEDDGKRLLDNAVAKARLDLTFRLQSNTEAPRSNDIAADERDSLESITANVQMVGRSAVELDRTADGLRRLVHRFRLEVDADRPLGSGLHRAA